MAGQNRAAPDPVALARELQREPYAFEFFAALRLLECAHPERPRIGNSLRPAEDPVRLGQEPSLAFAPSTLASFEPGTQGGAWRLAVLFLGLFGPNGPLPLHLTEYARDRLRNSADPTFARFADIFHHRMLSLFYRAWASAQPAVNFDRPESDRFGIYVGSLFGLAPPSLRDRDAMPDLAKLHYAGHLACPTKSAGGLAAILADFFEVPVEVEPFVGEWLGLPDRDLCRLGSSEETGTLGRSVTLGARIWECQHKFRVIVGPVALDEYEGLLPDAAALRDMAIVVRNYCGDGLGWELTLVLRRNELPPLVLGESGRLGWTSWLYGAPADRDPDDLTLTPFEHGV